MSHWRLGKGAGHLLVATLGQGANHNIYICIYIYVCIYIGKYNPQSSTNRGIEHCSIRGFQSHGRDPQSSRGTPPHHNWLVVDLPL